MTKVLFGEEFVLFGDDTRLVSRDLHRTPANDGKNF